MKTIISKGKAVGTAVPAKTAVIKPVKKSSMGKIALAVVATSILSAGGSGYLVSKMVSKNYEAKLNVLGTSINQNVPTVKTEVIPVNDQEVPSGGQDIVKIVVPYGTVVKLFKDDAGLITLSNIETSLSAVRLEQKGDYVKVTVAEVLTVQNALSEVWVDAKYVKDGKDISDDSYVVNNDLVVIKDTPTGFLRVRDSASLDSKEIGKVYPKEKYLLVSEDNNWYRIVLESGEMGWVSGEYTSLNK